MHKHQLWFFFVRHGPVFIVKNPDCIEEPPYHELMKLKAGVLGAGHLGKIHLKLLSQSEKYDLIGFYEPDQEQAAKVVEAFGYTSYDSLESLLEATDVVDIVTPTLAHFDCAQKAVLAGKHIFIEKPITQTLEEAVALRALAKKHRVRGQVGHVERFNPAFTAIRDAVQKPMFFEAHRLAEFNPRGTDVPVVLDLMIHDIDILLSLVDSQIKSIQASGISVLSETPDIANARIEFENGCVANLTASRISLKNMRKTRIFQKDTYITVDFLEKKSELIRMSNAPEQPGEFDMILQNAEGVKKQISFENPAVMNNNAILDELESFADAIHADRVPEVSLAQGTKALEVALEIIDCF